MFNKILPKAALLVFFVGMLSACGGGGSGASVATPPASAPELVSQPTTVYIPVAPPTAEPITPPTSTPPPSAPSIPAPPEPDQFTIYTVALGALFPRTSGSYKNVRSFIPVTLRTQDHRYTVSFIQVIYRSSYPISITTIRKGNVLDAIQRSRGYCNFPSPYNGVILFRCEDIIDDPVFSYNSNTYGLRFPANPQTSLYAFGFSGRLNNDGDLKEFGITYNQFHMDYSQVLSTTDDLLDHYRFGYLNNDMFIGTDNYRNAIFIIRHSNHKLSAIGNKDGYAARWEYKWDL